jgi:hypothetical protein
MKRTLIVVLFSVLLAYGYQPCQEAQAAQNAGLVTTNTSSVAPKITKSNTIIFKIVTDDYFQYNYYSNSGSPGGNGGVGSVICVLSNGSTTYANVKLDGSHLTQTVTYSYTTSDAKPSLQIYHQVDGLRVLVLQKDNISLEAKEIDIDHTAPLPVKSQAAIR